MGGTRWGMSSVLQGDDVRPLAYSVVPSIGAWLLLLLPAPVCSLSLACAFPTLLWFEKRHSFGRQPRWWLAMRTPLTVGATICLLLGTAGIAVGTVSTPAAGV